MDKKKSILNVTVSVSFKIITMVMAIVVKRVLIKTCGNEVNGLNALYLSIIGILAIAELGVGSAISFCMYKPIVAGDEQRVSALYYLLKRLYLLIGGIILIAGLLLTPFLHYFIKDYSVLRLDVYYAFVLMLVSVVLTYLFGAKTALINAYKNNYITTAISSGGILLQYVLQIAVLKWTGSFTWYLVCRIVAVVAQWIITNCVTREKYGNLVAVKAEVDRETYGHVTKHVRAMFMHKIGSLLVHTVDSLIISVFIGVVVLGTYSNYVSIMGSMTGILAVAFSSLTSIVGHLFYSKDKETACKYSEMIYLASYVLAVVFFLGYYAVIDSLVGLLFGQNLVVEKSISLTITLNGFVQFMRNPVLMFRDATGAFYNDRWKPLAEGLANLVLSILFVKKFGVVGVIMATILTNLLICHTIEPYVLYRYSFEKSPKEYYRFNYGLILLFVVALAVLNSFVVQSGNLWYDFFVNGFRSVGVSMIVCGAVLFLNKDKIAAIKCAEKERNFTESMRRPHLK